MKSEFWCFFSDLSLRILWLKSEFLLFFIHIKTVWFLKFFLPKTIGFASRFHSQHDFYPYLHRGSFRMPVRRWGAPRGNEIHPDDLQGWCLYQRGWGSAGVRLTGSFTCQLFIKTHRTLCKHEFSAVIKSNNGGFVSGLGSSGRTAIKTSSSTRQREQRSGTAQALVSLQEGKFSETQPEAVSCFYLDFSNKHLCNSVLK